MKEVVTYEGVTFVVAVCLAMGKDEFISFHLDSFWLDRDKRTRKRMLSEAWDKINETEDK